MLTGINSAARFSKRFTRLTQLEEDKMNMRMRILKEGPVDDGKNIWYIDVDERVRKVTSEYQPKAGVYRVKPLEPIYRWWISRSKDVRNAIIPIFLSLISGTWIYNGANYIIEREERIVEKSRVDPEFTESNLKEWVQKKQQS